MGVCKTENEGGGEGKVGTPENGRYAPSRGVSESVIQALGHQ